MNIKTYRITLSLLILLILIVLVGVLVSQPRTEEKAPQAAPLSMEAAYTLREYEERIGVFRTTEESPFMMIDVYVANLPAADQMELRSKGILVEDDNKLQSLIEDFES